MRIYSQGKSIQVLGKQGIRGMAGPDGNPIGTVISYVGETPPEDYLVCNGAQYEISEFQDLADFFQTQFGDKHKFGGSGDSFAVPNFPSEENVLKCIKATKEAPYEDIYSEEETVIGRWIDGKPLYRKVIHATSPSTTGSWANIYSEVADIDYISSITGSLYDASIDSYNYLNYSTGTGTSIALTYHNRIGIDMVAQYRTFANCPVILIIEYTKTTDDPIT